MKRIIQSMLSPDVRIPDKVKHSQQWYRINVVPPRQRKDLFYGDTVWTFRNVRYIASVCC